MPQIRLKIDGKEVVVEKGTNLIEAAKQVGIHIPHFCYHPQLDPDANCRMCMVRIEKVPKLQTACSTFVTDGMEITTNSQEVFDAHKLVIEFLLANHPIDCPVCDRGGECDLQDLSHPYADMGSRYIEPKRRYEKEYFGPFIEKEMNRCIQCMRCVRYCDEVQDVQALGAIGRGGHAEIGAFNRNPLECVNCGGCIMICPDGALTSRVSMLEYRPWEMKRTETVCNYCSDGCRMFVDTRDGIVKRVAAEWGEGPNEGNLCAKGFFGYKVVNHPDRLSWPRVRKDGVLKEVPWEEALNEAAQKLLAVKAKHGSGAVAGLITARCTNEELYLFGKFMRLAVGSPHVDGSSRYGHIVSQKALARVAGTPRAMVDYRAVAEAKAILLVGSDITESNPIAALKVIRAARKKGAHLVIAHPFDIHLARRAAAHLKIAPGAERDLILALIKSVVEGGRVDSAVAERAPEYVKAIRDACAKVSQKELAASTGVPWDAIDTQAAALSRAGSGVILIGQEIMRDAGGYGTVVDILDLAVLLGWFGREGSGVLPLGKEPNDQGVAEMGAAAEYLPGFRPAEDAKARDAVAQAWAENIPSDRGMTLMEILEGARQGRIKAIYCVGENPLETLPASAGVVEALRNLDCLIVQEQFLTETAARADVVLPVCSYVEKEGTFTNQEGRVQRIRPGLDPIINESRPDWQIFSALAGRLGSPLEYLSSREISREISKVVGRPVFAFPPEEAPGRQPVSLDAYLGGGFAADLTERYTLLPHAAGEGTHTLVIGPVLYHSGKMTLRSDELLVMWPEPAVLIHPEDAARIEVEDGKTLTLSNARGRVETRARVTDKVAPGTLFFPEHFSSPPVKDLAETVVDAVTKTPSFKLFRVSVSKS